MPQRVHVEALELILASVSPTGDRLLSSFLYGKPGAPHWNRRFGAEIFVRPKDYFRALLFIRQNGAAYLRTVSISELWSMVADFLTENFWYIQNSMFAQQEHRSYLERVSEENKVVLALALARSTMFQPESELSLYPLLPIRVKANFETNNFFLINAADLSPSHLPSSFDCTFLEPGRFPPFAHDKGRKRSVVSWLGVRSPLPPVAGKITAAILGAVALTPIPRERYMCSMRQVFGGQCTITNTSHSVSYGITPHTPPLMHDIVLTKDDHAWLVSLAKLLEGSDKPSRSRLRALEYFFRAWFLNPRERFPVLCMSLDSLVGVSSNHTSEAVKYVKKVVSTAIDSERLRLLLRLRGAVIHGAAPDVYDSDNYEKYYEDYLADPIYDLELIVAKALRHDIFGSSLKYHDDPNAEIIAKAQAMGRLPKTQDQRPILDENI